MSLDKTLENLNSSMNKLTTDVSSLLATIQIIAVVFALICTVLAIGFLILACYVKCKRVHLDEEDQEMRASQIDLTKLMVNDASKLKRQS